MPIQMWVGEMFNAAVDEFIARAHRLQTNHPPPPPTPAELLDRNEIMTKR